MARTIGHNGTTGWVCSPRTQERCEKRTERARAIQAAWEETTDTDHEEQS